MAKYNYKKQVNPVLPYQLVHEFRQRGFTKIIPKGAKRGTANTDTKMLNKIDIWYIKDAKGNIYYHRQNKWYDQKSRFHMDYEIYIKRSAVILFNKLVKLHIKVGDNPIDNIYLHES